MKNGFQLSTCDGTHCGANDCGRSLPAKFSANFRIKEVNVTKGFSNKKYDRRDYITIYLSCVNKFMI